MPVIKGLSFIGVTGTGTDNRIARWDGTDNIQDSLCEIDDLGNMTVYGNLTVNGDTTTQNVTTWTVEDKNIEMAKGSADGAAADGAGITVDRGSDTNASLIFDHASEKWQIGLLGSESEILDIDSEQTLTNKIIGSNLPFVADGAHVLGKTVGGVLARPDIVHVKSAIKVGEEDTETGKLYLGDSNTGWGPGVFGGIHPDGSTPAAGYLSLASGYEADEETGAPVNIKAMDGQNTALGGQIILSPGFDPNWQSGIDPNMQQTSEIVIKRGNLVCKASEDGFYEWGAYRDHLYPDPNLGRPNKIHVSNEILIGEQEDASAGLNIWMSSFDSRIRAAGPDGTMKMLGGADYANGGNSDAGSVSLEAGRGGFDKAGDFSLNTTQNGGNIILQPGNCRDTNGDYGRVIIRSYEHPDDHDPFDPSTPRTELFAFLVDHRDEPALKRVDVTSGDGNFFKIEGSNTPDVGSYGGDISLIPGGGDDETYRGDVLHRGNLICRYDGNQDVLSERRKFWGRDNRGDFKRPYRIHAVNRLKLGERTDLSGPEECAVTLGGFDARIQSNAPVEGDAIHLGIYGGIDDSNGGDVRLYGRDANDAGSIQIYGGTSAVSSAGGKISLTAGTGTSRQNHISMDGNIASSPEGSHEWGIKSDGIELRRPNKVHITSELLVGEDSGESGTIYLGENASYITAGNAGDLDIDSSANDQSIGLTPGATSHVVLNGWVHAGLESPLKEWGKKHSGQLRRPDKVHIISELLIGEDTGEEGSVKLGDSGNVDLTSNSGVLEITASEVQTSANLEVLGQAWSAQDTESGSGTTHTIDWDDGNSTVLDLDDFTGDVTLTLSNPQSGASYVIKVIQDSSDTNDYDIVWPGSVLWPGGTPPVITQTSDAIDVISLYYDGTNYLGAYSQDVK
jgi:hypothetical protein